MSREDILAGMPCAKNGTTSGGRTRLLRACSRVLAYCDKDQKQKQGLDCLSESSNPAGESQVDQQNCSPELYFLLEPQFVFRLHYQISLPWCRLLSCKIRRSWVPRYVLKGVIPSRELLYVRSSLFMFSSINSSRS
jgi:hypothetical protein